MKKLRYLDHFTSPDNIRLGYFMSFPPYTQMHSHEFYEFFIIASGNLIHRTEGLPDQILHEGTLVFIRPEDAHGFVRNGEEDCYFINVAFPRENITALSVFLDLDRASHALFKSPNPPSFSLPLEESLRLIDRLEMLQRLSEEDKTRVFRGLLGDMVARYFTQSYSACSDTPEWLVLLCSKMRQSECFLEGIKRMHALANCSPEHLSRSMRKHMDITPSEFINQLRLNFACGLLKSTQEPIINIAYESGFESLSYFNRLFKKQFNVTPREFRKSSTLHQII